MSQAGIINVIDNNPTIPIYFEADTGFAVALFNVIRILGDGTNITTSASGNTVNIAFSGNVMKGVTVDGSTPPGTNPVLPNGSGNITVSGAQVAAGTTTNAIRTFSTAANSYQIQIQRSSAQATTTVGANGVAHFNSAQFSVDANGFVSTTGNVFIGLTPDAGGQVTPVAGNINVFGQKTGTNAQSMMTNKVGANFVIEDRTWFTAYVVDPSSTAGTRGTFTTIQAAINAIIADGIATTTRYGLVKVRAGNYDENITIGAQRIYLQAMVPEPWPSSGQVSVFVNGTLTLGSGNVFLENIGFIGNAAMGSGQLNTYNSFLNGVSGSGGSLAMTGGELRDLNTTGTQISCDGTYLSYQSFFTATAGTILMNNCVWNSGVANPFSLNGTSTAAFNNCLAMVIAGNTTGEVSIQQTGFQLPPNLPNAASVQMSGNYRSNFVTPTTGGAQQNLYTSGNNNQLFNSLQGNVLVIKKTAVSYNVLNTDYYIGITDTTAARTMTLPASGLTGNKIGQTYIFKDESGGAATNNITITASSGTIDGAASAVINTNYGSIKIVYDGTNYFII